MLCAPHMIENSTNTSCVMAVVKDFGPPMRLEEGHKYQATLLSSGSLGRPILCSVSILSCLFTLHDRSDLKQNICLASLKVLLQCIVGQQQHKKPCGKQRVLYASNFVRTKSRILERFCIRCEIN